MTKPKPKPIDDSIETGYNGGMEKYASLRKVNPQVVREFAARNPDCTLSDIAFHFSKRGVTITKQRVSQILKSKRIGG